MKNILKDIRYVVVAIASLILTVAIVQAATLTTINGSDLISASRAVINTNFSNLNTDKADGDVTFITVSNTSSLSFERALAVDTTYLALTDGGAGGALTIGMATGFSIPLTASTSAWESFRDTPSGRITAGTGLAWSGNTLAASGAIDTEVPVVTIGNTASLAFERALTGTANQITVTDGGANGAVTLSLPALLSFTAASISGNFEVSGTASMSYLRLSDGTESVPALTFGTGNSNGLHLQAAGVIDVNVQNQFRVDIGGSATIYEFRSGAFLPAPTAVNDLGGASNYWKDFFTTNASISNNLEVAQKASSSALFGSGLSDCDGAGGQLLWNVTTGLFSCETLADADIPDTITASNYLPLAGGTLTGNLIGTGATLSGTLEVVGVASISAFRLPLTTGGILGDCDGANDTLNWDTTTGKFVCGSDSAGSVSSNSIDFDEIVPGLHLDTNTSIASGGFMLTGNMKVGLGSSSPMTMLALTASKSWQSTGLGMIRTATSVSGIRESIVMTRLTGTTGGLSFVLDNKGTGGRKFEFFATDSGNGEGAGKFIIFNNATAAFTINSDNTASTADDFEVSGEFRESGAGSSSFAGGVEVTKGIHASGMITALTSGLGVVGNVLKAISQFFFPVSADPALTVSGQGAINTASGSFEYHDGTNVRVISRCTRRPSYMLKGTDLTAKNQWSIMTADDHSRISWVNVTASGSGSLTWNLLTGSGTVPTTAIWTAGHKASGSGIVKYTTFSGTSSISDSHKLDIVVTSTSATLDSVLVSTCIESDTTP